MFNYPLPLTIVSCYIVNSASRLVDRQTQAQATATRRLRGLVCHGGRHSSVNWFGLARPWNHLAAAAARRNFGSVIYRSVLLQPPPDRRSLLLLRHGESKVYLRPKRRALTAVADDSQTPPWLPAQPPQQVDSTSHHTLHSPPHSISAAITFPHFRTARFRPRSHLIIATLSGFV